MTTQQHTRRWRDHLTNMDGPGALLLVALIFVAVFVAAWATNVTGDMRSSAPEAPPQVSQHVLDQQFLTKMSDYSMDGTIAIGVMGQDKVLANAQHVCPSMRQGWTKQDLAQLAEQGNLNGAGPDSISNKFTHDAAVSLVAAAINTYCPEEW